MEIDCHDGWDEPIVKHGYTITKSVTFESIIREIGKFCDEYQNHTPIILSLENHCDNDNQLKMANIMDEVFGKKIVRIREID